jgi:hypothetical protein
MAMACLVLDVQLLMVHLKVLLKNMFLKTRQNDLYGQTRNAPFQVPLYFANGHTVHTRDALVLDDALDSTLHVVPLKD